MNGDTQHQPPPYTLQCTKERCCCPVHLFVLFPFLKNEIRLSFYFFVSFPLLPLPLYTALQSVYTKQTHICSALCSYTHSLRSIFLRKLNRFYTHLKRADEKTKIERKGRKRTNEIAMSYDYYLIYLIHNTQAQFNNITFHLSFVHSVILLFCCLSQYNDELYLDLECIFKKQRTTLVSWLRWSLNVSLAFGTFRNGIATNVNYAIIWLNALKWRSSCVILIIIEVSIFLRNVALGRVVYYYDWDYYINPCHTDQEKPTLNIHNVW